MANAGYGCSPVTGAASTSKGCAVTRAGGFQGYWARVLRSLGSRIASTGHDQSPPLISRLIWTRPGFPYPPGRSLPGRALSHTPDARAQTAAPDTGSLDIADRSSMGGHRCYQGLYRRHPSGRGFRLHL